MKRHLLAAPLLFAMAFGHAQNMAIDSLQKVLSGQKAIDSLQKVLSRQKEDTNKVNTLLEISIQFMLVSNPNKHLEYATKALELSEKLGFHKGKGKAYSQMAVVNLTLDSQLSLKQRQLSLQCYEAANDKENAAYSAMYIGNWYGRQQNYSEALRYHSQALRHFVSIKDNKGAAQVHFEMGLFFFNQNNFSEAVRHCMLGVDQLKGIRDGKGIAKIYGAVGYEFIKRKNYFEGIRYYSQAAKQYVSLKDKISAAHLYLKLSWTLHSQANYSEAIRFAYEALRLFDELGDTKGRADCYVLIATTYTSQENDSEALNSAVQALALLEKTDDAVAVGFSCIDVGNLYLRKARYDEAFAKFQRALKISTELKVIRRLLSTHWLLLSTQFHLGKYYEATARVAALGRDTVGASEKYRQALYNNFQVLNALKAMRPHNPEALGDVYAALGRIYTKQKNYAVARNYLDSSLRILTELGPPAAVGEVHLYFSEIDSLQGDYRQALYHYKAFRRYNDSAWGVTSQREFTQMKMRYEFGKTEDSLKTQQLLTDEKLKKQQLLALQQLQRLQINEASLKLSKQQSELNRLAFLNTQATLLTEQSESQQRERQLRISEQEKALQQATLKAKTAELQLKEKEAAARGRERNLIIAGSFLVLLLGAAFWRSNRQKQKAYNLLEKQNLRTAISSDLHDEVGSALSAISIFSEMAKRSAANAEREEKYLQRIGERSRESIEKMGDIIWSVNPENDSLQQILLRMKTHAAEVAEAKGMAVHWTEGESITRTNLNMTERKNFYLLFKEGFNNAVKYSGAKNIHVELNAVQGNVNLIIKDDGVGFDIVGTPSGNGLKTMQRRAALLGGHLRIKSAPGSGTTLSFSFGR